MKLYPIISFLFLAHFAMCQIEDVDTVITSRAKNLSLKEVVIKRMDLEQDTLLIKRFDNQGNIIESLSPLVGNTERIVYQFDTLQRKTRLVIYNNEDTTKIDSERKWYYKDSNHYTVEVFGENHRLYETTEFEITYHGDTAWVTEFETNHDFTTKDKKVSRYTQVGDSLLVSEFITYTKEGELHGINAYYDLRKQNDVGQFVHTAGQYTISSKVWDNFHKDFDLLKDFYSNPAKYLQKQLNGEFPYEYDEFPHTYEVYNAQHQLIQNGNWPFKELYEYNSNGQLVKKVIWGENWLNDNEIVPHEETIYEYDNNGLPKSITSKSIERNKTITYIYEYHF